MCFSGKCKYEQYFGDCELNQGTIYKNDPKQSFKHIVPIYYKSKGEFKMITFQISNEKIKEIIPILQKEMEKNSDGYINITLESEDHPIPTPCWTEEIDC